MGTLFRLDATGAITTLHHFSGADDGAQPYGLVQASDGRFYGATRSGASGGANTVFRFTPGSGFTTLYTFGEMEGSPVDLFAASDGNVYGLLERGGDFGNGAIFVIDSGGAVVAIHNIPLTAGLGPSSFIKGSDGRFYVTATGGGTLGSGTIFAIDDAGTITPLHDFGGVSAGDGSSPTGLMQGGDGRLYGTTRRSGSVGPPLATVYAVDLAGNYELLETFPQGTVQVPGSDLVEASDGNFYGVTTTFVFRLTPSGTLTTVGGGFTPGELIQGADGRLYGATVRGGTDGGGLIIAMDLTGARTTLHEFTVGADDAGIGRPHGVIQARDGRFYGATGGVPLADGINGRVGTLFAMDAAGALTTLHSFIVALTGGVFGTPGGNLFEGADGSVYGTTFSLSDCCVPPGQLYKFSPSGVFTNVTALGSLRHGVIRST